MIANQRPACRASHNLAAGWLVGPCASAKDECLDTVQLLYKIYILHSIFVKPTADQRPELSL